MVASSTPMTDYFLIYFSKLFKNVFVSLFMNTTGGNIKIVQLCDKDP